MLSANPVMLASNVWSYTPRSAAILRVDSYGLLRSSASNSDRLATPPEGEKRCLTKAVTVDFSPLGSGYNLFRNSLPEQLARVRNYVVLGMCRYRCKCVSKSARHLLNCSRFKSPTSPEKVFPHRTTRQCSNCPSQFYAGLGDTTSEDWNHYAGAELTRCGRRRSPAGLCHEKTSSAARTNCASPPFGRVRGGHWIPSLFEPSLPMTVSSGLNSKVASCSS